MLTLANENEIFRDLREDTTESENIGAMLEDDIPLENLIPSAGAHYGQAPDNML